MDRAGIVTGTTTTNTRKTTMKTRASLSPRSMTPGSTWTNGGTLMIVWWSLVEFLLPAASCSQTGALDREPPDAKRLTEASGNEGATYERSYHRAALVLWRQGRSVDVLLQAGVVAALPYLKQLAARGKRAQPEAISVAERILEAWPGHVHRWDSYSTFRELPGPADRTEMIVALTRLNAPALLERLLREVITSGYDGSEKAALLASVSVLGDAHAAAVLSGLVSARMPERPNECSELLRALSENPSLCFPEAAEAAVAALDFIGTHDKGTKALDWEPEEPQRPLDPQFLRKPAPGVTALQGRDSLRHGR